MYQILTANQMKLADTTTMETFGLLSPVLMERAALAVLEVIEKEQIDCSKAFILCGSGNNGGDGLALARLLLLKGAKVTAVFLGNLERASEECKRQYDIYENYCKEAQASLVSISSEDMMDKPVMDSFADATVIIDAVFGIGLKRPLEGIYARVIELANTVNACRVAIDIASGIDADTGKILGCAFRSDVTVTFAYRKIGHCLYPGRSYTGKLFVKDIGINDCSLKKADIKPLAFGYDRKDLCLLPRRFDDSNKGSYGKVLVFAGAKNMAGAAIFASGAAYRAGAGLVTVCTDELNREIVQKKVPEAVLVTYSAIDASSGSVSDLASSQVEKTLETILPKATVLVAGPGIGTEDYSRDAIRYILEHGRVPLVLDADALNIISGQADLLIPMLHAYKGPVIMTPHLGEASRLLGCEINNVKNDLLQAAKDISERYHCICVLKDAATIVYAGDIGYYINSSGNNGMSTGGSGDVLSGIIGGLLAQKSDPVTAATLGVYLHGRSGDIGAEHGRASLTASDLVECIGKAMTFDRGF